MEKLKLETVLEETWFDRDRERNTRGILSTASLRRDNQVFAQTTGVSRNNRGLGFAPGYLDSYTGQIRISRFADGRPAPIHLLDGLPESWVTERDANGRVLRTRAGIIAGFVHNRRFYTREQAALIHRH